MNRYAKEFFHRGLLFGGFGPIIMGIVFAILERTLKDFSVSGTQILLAIVSTYLLAFVQAGASVFNQIEEWPLPKSLLFHFLSLYLAYSLCYLANSWIPFEPMVLVFFSLVFAVSYFVVWLTVFLICRAVSRKMTSKLR